MPDLPSEPSLSQLRHQARDLQRAVRAADPEALAEVAERHPSGRPDDAAAASFTLTAAQLVVARRYDFPGWVRLRRYVEVVERYSRFPARMTDAGSTTPAEEFLQLACLRYEDDQPERWAQANRILTTHPEITQVSVYAAAAAADVSSLGTFLAADPGAARRLGGPYRWEPLFYLAYTRHDPQIDQAAVLDAARMLLKAGADPNAGYLWHGLPTPFTVLTGVFGEGELGPRGCAVFLSEPRFDQLPCVLETGSGDAIAHVTALAVDAIVAPIVEVGFVQHVNDGDPATSVVFAGMLSLKVGPVVSDVPVAFRLPVLVKKIV